MSDDIVERLRSLSILDGWLPMMEEAAVEIDRQRKVISAMIEDCQYLKDKQIEAADEIEKLRAALKPFAAQLDHPGNTYEHNGVRMALVNQDILDRLCRRARAALEGVTKKEGAGNE